MKVKLSLFSMLFVLILHGPSMAADTQGKITFTKDVLPIIQENCQICHRFGGDNIAGMAAPMSLMNYNEVRPWAKAIAKVVASREMPPWDATDATHGQFINERYLTDDQIATIVILSLIPWSSMIIAKHFYKRFLP